MLVEFIRRGISVIDIVRGTSRNSRKNFFAVDYELDHIRKRNRGSDGWN